MLKQCQKNKPPKLHLDQNLQMTLPWAKCGDGSPIDGVRDFLREAGFIQSYDTEKPETKTKPFNEGIGKIFKKATAVRQTCSLVIYFEKLLLVVCSLSYYCLFLQSQL